MFTVDKSRNIILSSLSKEELTNLFKQINTFPMRFRKELIISQDFSFGNEIEINSIPLDKVVLLVELFNHTHELNGDDKYVVHQEETAAAEVVTPILNNTENNWITFYDMYEMLYLSGATIAGNTSSHVHVGTHKINTPEKLSLLLKTLVVFEPIIFKFGYGRKDISRALLRFRDENHCVFSPMMSPKRVRTFVEILDSYNHKSPGSMFGAFKNFIRKDLSFRPVFNFNNFDFSKLQYSLELEANDEDHMEVRCFNGSLNPEIVQNNINLIIHIIQAVVEDKIDKAYVCAEYEKYKKKRYDFDTRFAKFEAKKGEQYNRLLDGFSEVKLEKALKLADMIFNNELDKYYFLKQYLKLFEVEPQYVEGLVK